MRWVVLLTLPVLCAASCRVQLPDPPPLEELGAPPTGAAGLRVRGHAHNDYEQERPLLDSLDARLYSVEADLWWTDDAVLVSHDPWDYAGTLERLYLEPLQARVDAWGSVHGDDEPFYLWLDLKEGEEGLTTGLFELLESYPMLHRFRDDGETPGPVVAILTGDREAKRRFIEEHDERPATRDGHDYTADDPPADGTWGFYAFNWESYTFWRGDGELPAADRAALAELVDGCHDKGRPVRFWNLPDSEAGWQAALDLDVDFINTDHVEELGSFLAAAER